MASMYAGDTGLAGATASPSLSTLPSLTPVSAVATPVVQTPVAAASASADGNAPASAAAAIAGATVQTPAADPVRASADSQPLPLTQGGGFQVVVASGAATASDGLSVNRGVADLSVASGTATQFAIPADAFAASDVGAVVTLSAQQSNGQPLPGWIHFDAASGSFEGQPPPGYAGDVTIRVTARDAQGHEAVTTFKVKVGGRTASGDGQRAQPERAARAGLAEQLRHAARAHPALERLARLAGWRDAA